MLPACEMRWVMFSVIVCVCVCVSVCSEGGPHVAIGDLFKLVPLGKQAVGLLVYSVSHDEGQSVSKMCTRAKVCHHIHYRPQMKFGVR